MNALEARIRREKTSASERETFLLEVIRTGKNHAMRWDALVMFFDDQCGRMLPALRGLSIVEQRALLSFLTREGA